MKVIYFGKEAWEEAYIKEKLAGAEVIFYLGPIGQFPEARDSEAQVVSVFVNSPMGAAEMDRFPKLRLIATRSTGVDHVMRKRRKNAALLSPAYRGTARRPLPSLPLRSCSRSRARCATRATALGAALFPRVALPDLI